MREVNAFLIEPMAGTIRPVTINLETSYADIKDLVKCDLIDIVRVNGSDIIVDDNGLGDTVPCLTEVGGAPMPLAGNLLVTKSDIPGNPNDLWDWCLEQAQSTRLDLLAYAAVPSVNALQLGHYERKRQRAHADRLAHALAIDMTQWFEATADSYFGRVTKTGIEQAITEAKGADFAAACRA